MPTRRYMEEIESAAMLATKRSAGVAPEVNLGKHVTCMPLPTWKPRADITRSTKQGYQWHHKKDLCPQI